jgi:hypothetical protein
MATTAIPSTTTVLMVNCVMLRRPWSAWSIVCGASCDAGPRAMRPHFFEGARHGAEFRGKHRLSFRDDAAHPFRDDLAHRFEMMLPAIPG